jgi:phage shock protein PspC (stress-responsive transcriptional regulator)
MTLFETGKLCLIRRLLVFAIIIGASAQGNELYLIIAQIMP